MQRKMITESKGKTATKDGKSEKSLLKSLTVEPVLILHMTAAIMVFVAVQELLSEKACKVNLGFSDSVCTAIKTRENIEKYEKEEKTVQILLGELTMVKTALENIFPIVLVLLLGAWSDKYGTKLPMLFVVIGFALQNILLVLCIYFSNTLGAWSVVILPSLMVSLSGNLASFGMSVFSYASLTTHSEHKSIRTSITHSCFMLGLTLGLGLGGYFSKVLGYMQTIQIALFLEIICAIYIWIFIKNIRNEKEVSKISTGKMFKDLFNFGLIKDAIYSVIKKRPGKNTRLSLIALLLCHMCLFAPMMGEYGVMFLFGRLQFNWDAGSYGSFMTFKTVIGFFGSLLSMGILKSFKLSDPAIGIVACTSMLSAAMIYAFTKSSFVMYLVPVLSFLVGPLLIIPRSILSTVIHESELGKINAIIGSIESLVPFLSGPLYSYVYTKTMGFLPGGFFLLSASFMIPPIIIYLFFISSQKKDKKKN